MTLIKWSRFPLVAGDEYARRWLQFTANIGRAANTVDAYGRAVEDHLRFCQLAGAQPVTLRADVVAAWIADMDQRPLPSRDDAVVEIGLSNATIQQRVVAVRSFYDYLVEDGLRERNPVRRGQSGRRGQRPQQGLKRRVVNAPWIPNENAWARVLAAAVDEPLRNRLMLALAYDGALRREELVSLDVDDLEPAWSLVHLRAETTKSQRAREVTFGAATGQLLVAYLRQRRQAFGRIDGALLRSVSRRNHGEPRRTGRVGASLEQILRVHCAASVRRAVSIRSNAATGEPGLSTSRASSADRHASASVPPRAARPSSR